MTIKEAEQFINNSQIQAILAAVELNKRFNMNLKLKVREEARPKIEKRINNLLIDDETKKRIHEIMED